MSRLYFWSRLALRNGTLTSAVTALVAMGGLSLGLSWKPVAASLPAVTHAAAQPLAVLPAVYTDPPAPGDLSPDSVRLIQAYRDAGGATEGYDGLVRSLKLLAAGCENLEQIPDYTSTFVRRERIDGMVHEREAIFLKLRHKPLALYLNWTEGPELGRELIYAEGQNDGDMVLHPGGWKGRLLPTLKLNPHGRVALSYARHPVTELGLAAIGWRILEKRKADIVRGTGFRFTIDENATVEGRQALRCELLFDSPAVSDFYRKSVYCIDRELLIPVSLCNYAWPETPDVPLDQLDEETVVEDYLFTNLRFRPGLADADFDTTNEQYHFRR